MKKLTFAVIAAGLAWFAHWGVQAYLLNAATDRWFEQRRADGWQASYSDRSLRGFPNRLDLTFENLALADPGTGLVWEAPFFQIFRLVYAPDHVIMAFPPNQRVGTHQIESDGLRASLVREDGMLDHANLEATVLNVRSERGGAWAVSNLTAAFLRDGGPTRYRLAIQADALATTRDTSVPVVADSLRSVQADLHVTFSAPLRLDHPEPRPQPTRLEVRLAEYRLGGLELKLAGSADVDGNGRLDGKMTVKAVNWREMLDLARRNGQVPDGVAEALEQGLGLVAGLSGNPRTLDLPLTFRQGRMSLGPIPLGDAPRLRLP